MARSCASSLRIIVLPQKLDIMCPLHPRIRGCTIIPHLFYYQWMVLWVGKVVTTVYAVDSGGIERPRVVAQRGVALPGAAVAATSSSVTGGLERWSGTGAGISMSTNRPGGVNEEPKTRCPSRLDEGIQIHLGLHAEHSPHGSLTHARAVPRGELHGVGDGLTDVQNALYAAHSGVEAGGRRSCAACSKA